MARGDVVLFETSGSLTDLIISTATKGPYTHSEIDLGNGEMIGSQAGGLTRHKDTPGRNVVLFRPPTSQANIEAGLAWVEHAWSEQVKSKGAAHTYGWMDWISDFFKMIGHPLVFSKPGQWDCSEFVTRYLIAAEAEGPLGSQADDPVLISPNDLARAYGIL